MSNGITAGNEVLPRLHTTKKVPCILFSNYTIEVKNATIFEPKIFVLAQIFDFFAKICNACTVSESFRNRRHKPAGLSAELWPTKTTRLCCHRADDFSGYSFCACYLILHPICLSPGMRFVIYCELCILD